MDLHFYDKTMFGWISRLWRGVKRFFGKAKFSFACQKRTRKAPAISTRWIHEKGAARPFQTPEELSKRKKASRCAKRFFLVSPTCCFAAGVTFLQGVKFSDDVKSSAEP